jgi:ankyrin repeat protein
LGRDGDGKTPLHYAIHACCGEEKVPNKISIINLLLDAGASAGGGDDADLVLGICVDAPSSAHPVAVVAALLERDPGLLEHRGGDAPVLRRAVRSRKCNLSVITTLIEAGASVDTLAEGCETALVCALASNTDMEVCDKLDVLRVLLDAGADPRAHDRSGVTTLMNIVDRCSDDDATALFISDLLDYIKARRGEREASESEVDAVDTGSTGAGIGAGIGAAAALGFKASRPRPDEDVDDEKEPLRKRMKTSTVFNKL